MVGRDLSGFYKKDHTQFAQGEKPVALSVRNLSGGRLVRDCSFDLHRGEALGLSGLVGSSRTESALSIRARSPLVPAGSLSGGNQQKVLLARLLELKPRIVLLDEPTRGVDVGAKSEIYRLIDELAERDIAILLISSDLPEIVGVCDRTLVMREGIVVGEVRPKDGERIRQEDVIELATGACAA